MKNTGNSLKVLICVVFVACAFAIGWVSMTPPPAKAALPQTAATVQPETETITLSARQNRPKTPKTGEEIYEEADYLAQILVTTSHDDVEERSVGSGFLINFNGKFLVVTAGHVARIPKHTIRDISISFKNSPSVYYQARVDKVDQKKDIATLVITDQDFNFTGRLSRINLEKDFRVGNRVYGLGHPFNLGPSLGEGAIMNLEKNNGEDRDGNPEAVILHSATIGPGNSGGPLVDRYGEVIGMNVYVHRTFYTFGSAVYMTEIINWLVANY